MAVNDQDKAADDRIARLFREAAHEEPPAHLDNAIQRASRASGRPRPSRTQTWWGPWRLPFAFAAVAIVSVSLVTLVLEEGGERLTDAPQRPIEAKPQAPAELEAAAPGARSVPAEQSVQLDSRPPPAPDRGATRERAKTLQENTGSGNAGMPATERQSRAGETSSVQPRVGEAATSRPSEGATALQKTPKSSAPAPISARDAAAESSGAPAATPAPAPPAVEAAPAPPAAARMRKSESMAPPRGDAASEIAKLEREPPAVWLERIVILRGEGRESEADALLAEFKARFPGAALPAQRQ